MALSPEVMNILINEYFTDPKNLGYRKYGNLMDNENHLVFYAPQILSLINDPRPRFVRICNHEEGSCEDNLDHHEYVKNGTLPPRISEIFSGMEGAPNILFKEDLIQIYNFFKMVNPNLVNILKVE